MYAIRSYYELHTIQIELMNTMSHLATPQDKKDQSKLPLPKEMATFCEKWIDELEGGLSSKSEYFILPGGNEISALCHVVRSQLRSAERKTISLLV